MKDWMKATYSGEKEEDDKCWMKCGEAKFDEILLLLRLTN
jgi:hypothetical protein